MLSVEIYSCACITSIGLFLYYLSDDSVRNGTMRKHTFKDFKLSKNILVHSKTESTLLKCGKHYLCFCVIINQN